MSRRRRWLYALFYHANCGFLLSVLTLQLFVGYTWLVVAVNDPFSLKWFAFHPTLQTLSLGLFTYGEEARRYRLLIYLA